MDLRLTEECGRTCSRSDVRRNAIQRKRHSQFHPSSSLHSRSVSHRLEFEPPDTRLIHRHRPSRTTEGELNLISLLLASNQAPALKSHWYPDLMGDSRHYL